MNLILVDYHKGNIKSVERGLILAADGLGTDVTVTVSDDPEVIRNADAIVLPGVGAFTDAMVTMRELGIDSAVKDAVACGVPFLGICLGLHLMFEGGTEHAEGGVTPGLGLIPGIVDAMPQQDASGHQYKVPHVGWNSVEVSKPNSLFSGLDGEYFYFTHSYIAPEGPFTIAETTHSVTFPCAVQNGSAYGVQFHPEKSSQAGAAMLANFLKIAAKQ